MACRAWCWLNGRVTAEPDGTDNIDNGITVLVVDDEDDIRVLVRSLLERSGMQVVDEADDGIEALISVAQLDPPPVPTVIVLDQSMPGLSGLEVAERVLAKLPDQRIVLFSAFLSRDVREQAEVLGVRACVAKTDILRLPDIITDLSAA
jgi:CheY-like chemotaxis protein